ncbi:hypothetical protein J6500_21010 [Bradyrhizobium sp. WSM 1704]|uniref:hypothetical protein n=1 Tax=Bradyrhizobium semiaridum TaxID=2821404 RepID=UPI001CE2C693|nr:hypothetical protein [Bradyrhizobium semiaridum]MCA6124353.1 hypothetical protein [Bradyrhizobium semiaridum]
MRKLLAPGEARPQRIAWPSNRSDAWYPENDEDQGTPHCRATASIVEHVIVAALTRCIIAATATPAPSGTFFPQNFFRPLSAAGIIVRS